MKCIVAPMRTKIIQIGNSRGIRIPKAILEQCGLDGEVELETKGDRLIVRSASKARAGWEEAFQSMATRGDDNMLDTEAFIETTWDKDEWEW